MPDFAGERWRGQDRAGTRSKTAGTAGTRLKVAEMNPPRLQVRMVKKSASIKRGTSPLDTFRKLLDELRGGISSISRMKGNGAPGSSRDLSMLPAATSLLRAPGGDFPAVTMSSGPRGVDFSAVTMSSGPRGVDFSRTALSSRLGLRSRPNSAAIGEKLSQSLKRVRIVSVGKGSDPLGVKLIGLQPYSGGIRHTSALREVLHPTREFRTHTKEFVPYAVKPAIREWPPAVIQSHSAATNQPHTGRRPFLSLGGLSGSAAPVKTVGLGPVRFDIPTKITPVTGADREAVRTVREPYRGHPTQFPAAARVAQILRADSLIKNGEARPNSQLQALAQAAREGRMRDVADVDPQTVQALFEDSFGGQENAQRALYTPEIHAIVERQRVAVGMVQERVRRIRGLGKKEDIGELSVKTCTDRGRRSPAQQQYSFQPSIQTKGLSIPVPSGRASTETRHVHVRSTEEKYSPALQSMAAHNDFAHLPMAMEDLKEGAEEEREIKGPEAKTARDRRLSPVLGRGGAGKSSLERSPQEVRVPSAPSASSPSQKSAPSIMTMVKSAKPSAQRLTGQLTMVTKEGIQLGTAEFEGSLT